MKSGGLQAIFKLFFSPPPAPSLMWMCTCFYWLFKKILRFGLPLPSYLQV